RQFPSKSPGSRWGAEQKHEKVGTVLPHLKARTNRTGAVAKLVRVVAHRLSRSGIGSIAYLTLSSGSILQRLPPWISSPGPRSAGESSRAFRSRTESSSGAVA